MLKLICIELPSETKYMHFKYLGHPDTGKMDGERAKRVANLDRLMHDLTDEHEKNPNFKTIGDYYDDVMSLLWDISDMEKYLNSQGEKVKLFTGDPQQQFTYFGLENMTAIHDLRSCLNEIHLIVEEGEGSNLMTLSGEVNKESHFLKFIQVYTMCSIDVRTEYAETELAQVIFEFEDADIMTAEEKLEKKWTPKMDKEVDRQIQTEFEVERETGNPVFEAELGQISTPTYPNIYAKPAFQNAYQKTLKELDLLFNTNFKTYKLSRQNEKLTEEELFKEFELFKRKTMEDSISRMKQMAMEAKQIIYPESYVEKFPDIGSRPNYNIDFKAKTSFRLDPE